MNDNQDIPVDAEIPNDSRAVRLYGDPTDAAEDFPVLKAFQQYIDQEQEKARRRMLTLGIFFGVLMLVVISVFVVLLQTANQRNQNLNDRLVEFVMKDRERQAAVVVQPTAQPDNTAVLALTTKIEEMQKKMMESQHKAETAVRERDEATRQAAEAAKPKEPTKDELEIRRLKALLASEKKQQAAEREQRRQAEIEAYRREHYPELYETKPLRKKAPKRRTVIIEDDDDDLLDEDLEDEEDEVIVKPKKRVAKTAAKSPSIAKTQSKAAAKKPAKAKNDGDLDALDDADAISYFEEEETPSGEKNYSIPVEVKGTSRRWRIPHD